MALQVGDKVPPFTILRGHNDPLGSDELFAAGPTAIHFWPFAFTGSVAEGRGCEAQVCGFGNEKEQLAAKGVQLIGVSLDSPHVLKVWREKVGQDYPFYSDWNQECTKAFGVQIPEQWGYRPLVTRAAFIVDTDGVVRYADVREPTELPSWTDLAAAAASL